MPFGPEAGRPNVDGRVPRSAGEGAPVDPNSFWDEGSGAIQDVVEAAPPGDAQEFFGGMSTVQPSTGGHASSRRWRLGELRQWPLRRRSIAGIVGATALGVACVGVVGLVAADRARLEPSNVSQGVGRVARQSGEHASAPSTDSIDARMIEWPRLRRSVSVSHRGRSTHSTRHPPSPVVPSNSAQGEPVSYHEAPPVNQVATPSAESASALPAAPSPPQRFPATTASASDRSGASASRPAHPSPTGVLTCISNCG